MDRTAAQAWLDRYVEAWRSYDPAAIGDLFSVDITYRYHPSDDPIAGRDAVVASWLGDDPSGNASSRDEPGTYDATYTPFAVDGDTVVATGSSTYLKAPGGAVKDVYDNCFLMRFDADGRCSDFTELYVKRPR
ncbi:YybH family protein [Nocardioides mangrovi]|uniref:Nuclear transport factor 2 family protein n=1 Tax=Nocardioides mangrovi TaxID=2874580 RepID=A0ABS7UDC2_9ACTN|nr:nuclear transport factor 2 family protein [Nocardioides mangrovi]MBZ5738994.1 nuclear transport factor 2 family protein [Nocardioides mangrovi]